MCAHKYDVQHQAKEHMGKTHGWPTPAKPPARACVWIRQFRGLDVCNWVRIGFFFSQLETNSGIFHKTCSQRVNCAIRTNYLDVHLNSPNWNVTGSVPNPLLGAGGGTWCHGLPHLTLQLPKIQSMFNISCLKWGHFNHSAALSSRCCRGNVSGVGGAEGMV